MISTDLASFKIVKVVLFITISVVLFSVNISPSSLNVYAQQSGAANSGAAIRGAAISGLELLS